MVAKATAYLWRFSAWRFAVATDHRPLTTAFLHFLCTLCGEYAAPSLYIFSRRFHEPEFSPLTKVLSHVPEDSCTSSFTSNSVVALFLSCTKNTELTRRRFPRTFGFALSKKIIDAAIVIGTQPWKIYKIKTKAIGTMNSPDSWITYRTRFLVKAKQLTSSFTDALGRRHCGRKGDYLAEFSDGILRILSREFFEDVYVPLLADQSQQQANRAISTIALTQPLPWKSDASMPH